MDKTASKPMPCPFCGSNPRVELYNPHDAEPSAQICCYNLRCSVRPYLNIGSYEETLAAWNRRSPSEPQAHPAPVSKDPGEAVAFLWVASDGERMVTFDRPFTAYTPLYSAPLPEARGAEEAAAVMAAVRSLRQDVRPYMRHLEDCDLVKYREGTYLPPRTIYDVPPCSCGLEKVLWDIPAENETGRTK